MKTGAIAENFCETALLSSYALAAERKMGEMLLETERAKGGQPYQSTSNTTSPVEPTLAELGLTKRDKIRNLPILQEAYRDKCHNFRKPSQAYNCLQASYIVLTHLTCPYIFGGEK